MIFKPVNKYILDILYHPAMLALPVALLIILLTPDVFDKYTITSVAEKLNGKDINIEYYDLDHDGISEWYYAGPGAVGGSSIALRNQKGVVFDWKIDGIFPPNRVKCMVGDYDNDGIDEIYTFTVKKDSLLVNGVNYLQLGTPEFKNYFISRINGIEPLTEFSFFPGKLTDLTGDGYKELVFAISTGYGLSPRKVFGLDIKNKQVLSSPELGGHLSSLDFADIDHDGKDEIAVSNYGPGNIKDATLLMQDTCAYVLVLDPTLNFLFPPIPFKGRYNGIQSKFIKVSGGYQLACYFGCNSQAPGVSSLKQFDIHGNLIRKKDFSPDYRNKSLYMENISFTGNDDKIIIAPIFENIQIYSNHLELLKSEDIQSGEMSLMMYDFDQDGEKEILIKSIRLGKWMILRNTLKYPVTFNTYVSTANPLLFTILNGEKKPQICMQLGERQYIMEYGFNSLYYWQYPVYIAIYLGILGFILLIQRILKIQMQKKYEIDKQIADLQYISLQNQIAPHFTFNVLNTIGSAIMQEKKEEAYQMLLKFSKLIRSLLTNPETVTRTLKEELEFVTNFLDLQMHRFKDLFVYQVDIDPKADMNQWIPKSSIQTYVENALKHGITPMNQKGVIKIMISKTDNSLEIKVTDNGVGREKAAQTVSNSTGRGLKIMQQYYMLLNKENNEPITEEFKDLMDENGKPAGTEVTIRIPDHFQFSMVSMTDK